MLQFCVNLFQTMQWLKNTMTQLLVHRDKMLFILKVKVQQKVKVYMNQIQIQVET